MTLLEKLKENARWVLLAVVTVLVFLTLPWKCGPEADINVQLSQAQAEARYWKDQAGNAHATVAKVTAEKAQMKALVDSQAKVLRIKPKQVIKYVTATAGIDTTIKPTYDTIIRVDTVRLTDSTYRLDTVRQTRINYQDATDPSRLSITGTLAKDSALKVSLRARISVTDYWRRKWFLGKKHYYTDIGTDNPYITFSNASSIERAPPRTLKVRPGVGAGLLYNPLTRRLDYGLQAGVYLFLSR